MSAHECVDDAQTETGSRRACPLARGIATPEALKDPFLIPTGNPWTFIRNCNLGPGLVAMNANPRRCSRWRMSANIGEEIVEHLPQANRVTDNHRCSIEILFQGSARIGRRELAGRVAGQAHKIDWLLLQSAPLIGASQ
jgi:hypothetical protein